MSENKSILRAWHYWLLWVVALLSLIMSALLLAGLIDFRLKARQQVQDAAVLLGGLELENFDLAVAVDETLTVSTTVPFSDTFTVPISATVPVSTSILFEDNISVPINTIIPVNTNINVPIEIPVVGALNVPFPISTNIPVNLNVNVPISKDVPIQLDIPVDLLIDVPIQSDIPIETDVPVKMEFPVTIPLDEMGFQRMLQRVQEALGLLAALMGAE